MRKGTNLPAIGGFNQTVILDAIRRASAGLSRVELVEKTGLASQTISNVSRRLLDDGLIREAGKHITGPGKPRVILELAPEGRFAVGVHLDPSVITYAVIDMRGRVVAHTHARTPSAARPDEVIATIVASVEEIMRAPGVSRERVLGIGIASPGPIDVNRGIVLDPPLLEGWRDVPLRDSLQAATGLPVLLEKDVNAAVVAELWSSGDSQRGDFAFFYLGTGIGVGLALAGEVFRGSSGNAGEGGTLFVPVTGLVDGRHADMLGRLATPGYLVEQAVDAGVLPGAEAPSGLEEVERSFDELLRRADAGDEPSAVILDRAADLIAAALVTVVNLLDVDEIVFGGPYWERVAPRFQPRIERVIAQSSDRKTHHPVRISLSAVGEDVAAVGAACLVLDDTLSPRPSSLLIAN
jgi:predicted NBD/HSP70 family sugar kinase